MIARYGSGRAVLLEAGATRDDHGAGIEAGEERADERGLADPGLARDEAQLPAAAPRPLERRAQHRELGIAPDDEGIDGRDRRWARRLDVVAQLGHEPVAAPDHGLDHALAEHLPQLVQMAAHRAVADDGAAPHLGDQLLVRDELLRVRDEVAQDREGLPAQDERGLALPQPPFLAVQSKWRKRNHEPALLARTGPRGERPRPTGHGGGPGGGAPIQRGLDAARSDPTEIRQPWTGAAGMVSSWRRFDTWWPAPTSASTRNRPSSWPSRSPWQRAPGSPWSTSASRPSTTSSTKQRLLQGQEALSRVVARHRRHRVQVTGVLRSGKPWEKLDNVAAEVGASLIVIGRHGAGRGRSVELGSVADRLVRTANRHVLTVACDFDRLDTRGPEQPTAHEK